MKKTIGVISAALLAAILFFAVAPDQALAMGNSRTLEKKTGFLNVSPEADTVVVTITGNRNEETVTYDGSTHRVEGYTFSASNALYDETKFHYDGNAAVSGMKAGTYQMNIDITKFVNDDAENFPKVSFVLAGDGALTISPCTEKITVRTESRRKKYDGIALSSNASGPESYSVEGSPVEGDVLKVIFENSQTNAGSMENIAEVTILRGTEDVTGCYQDVTVIPGVLSVEKMALTLTSGSKTKYYDGKELSAPEVSITKGSLVGEDTLVYNGFSTVLNAGKAENTFTYAATGGMKTENYDIKVVYGTLEVLPRNVVITSASESRAYDGTALMNANVTASDFIETEERHEGFVSGEGFTAKTTGSVTFPGQTAENTFDYELKAGTLPQNYNINKVEGQLSVVNRLEGGQMNFAVIVRGADGKFAYDNKVHTISGFSNAYRASLPFAVNAKDYEVKFISADRNSVTIEILGRTYVIQGLSAEKAAWEVGNYSVDVTGTAIVTTLDEENRTVDVTANFDIIGEAGELIIDPLYRLTIHYLDEKGQTMAPDYSGAFTEGEIFRINSPEVEGLTANFLFIQSGAGGMVPKDVEVNVVYKEEKTLETEPSGESEGGETSSETEKEPRGGEIRIDEESGIAVLEEVEETKTPLAPGLVNGDKKCVLQFLLLFAALVILIVYAVKRKKHLNRMRALEKELCEAEHSGLTEKLPSTEEM